MRSETWRNPQNVPTVTVISTQRPTLWPSDNDDLDHNRDEDNGGGDDNDDHDSDGEFWQKKNFVAILKYPLCSFAVKLNEEDEEVEATSWTTKMPKAAQPNLNYIGASTIK